MVAANQRARWRAVAGASSRVRGGSAAVTPGSSLPPFSCAPGPCPPTILRTEHQTCLDQADAAEHRAHLLCPEDASGSLARRPTGGAGATKPAQTAKPPNQAGSGQPRLLHRTGSRERPTEWATPACALSMPLPGASPLAPCPRWPA